MTPKPSPDYEILRYLCAVSTLALLVIIALWHRQRMFWFGLLFSVSLLNLLIPREIWNPLWWRYQFMPMAAIRVCLAGICSMSVFGVFQDWNMRALTRAGCFLIAILISVGVLTTWSLMPADAFPGLAIARQYLLLDLAVVTQGMWMFMRRPPQIALRYGMHWCAWLWCEFLASSTTKGGMLWWFVSWKGGFGYWSVVTETAFIGQAIICLAWAISLYFRRKPEPPWWAYGLGSLPGPSGGSVGSFGCGDGGAGSPCGFLSCSCSADMIRL